MPYRASAFLRLGRRDHPSRHDHPVTKRASCAAAVSLWASCRTPRTVVENVVLVRVLLAEAFRHEIQQIIFLVLTKAQYVELRAPPRSHARAGRT